MTGQRGGRRERIFERDGFRCVYCAAALPEAELTLDHVEPRMRGGDHSEGNLVTCCQACNRLKGGLAAWAFLPRHPEYLANFLTATEAARPGHARPVWQRLRRAVIEAAGAASHEDDGAGSDGGRGTHARNSEPKPSR
jgi:hypothetical protein